MVHPLHNVSGYQVFRVREWNMFGSRVGVSLVHVSTGFDDESARDIGEGEYQPLNKKRLHGTWVKEDEAGKPVSFAVPFSQTLDDAYMQIKRRLRRPFSFVS